MVQLLAVALGLVTSHSVVRVTGPLNTTMITVRTRADTGIRAGRTKDKKYTECDTCARRS